LTRKPALAIGKPTQSSEKIIGKRLSRSSKDRVNSVCRRRLRRKPPLCLKKLLAGNKGEHKAKVETITSDNGREFANHQQIAAKLEAEFFFAHPYHSRERGVNENTNGLVRQYFPKKMEFASITDEQVQAVEDKLNSRPRKSLGWRTPKELFFKEQKIALQLEFKFFFFGQLV
jgi:IS30 family transposase